MGAWGAAPGGRPAGRRQLGRPAGPLALLSRIERGQAAPGDLEGADWTLPSRLAASLAQAGLARVDLARAASALSGGQVTRAGLAAVLIAEPDIILLDDPTNNLDAEARGAVSALLEAWGGGVMAISHDRGLLRRMDRIVELSGLGARVYGGDYDLYAVRKAEEAAAAARDLEAAEQAAARVDRAAQQARERQARKDAVGQHSQLKGDMPKMTRDFRAERAENTGARQGRLAERQRAEARGDLESARARVERARRLAFDLPPSGLAPAKPVLAFETVAFGWPGAPPLFAGVSFALRGPERIALTGVNSAGKTTLIRLAVGELAPTAGTIVRGVRAVALDQRAALLDDGQTLLENFRRLNPEADDNLAHAALARFLFRNTAALRPAAALSGGERLRAALACVLMGPRPPQLIILDEPTNHLDLDSIVAVESALAAYDGALIIASHDEDFLAAARIERRLSAGA